LVSNTQARPKRPRIILRKVAVAAPGTGAFKYDCSRQTTCSRIRRCGREIRQGAVMLSLVRLIVVPETVVECQFARDLPRILSEKPNLMFALLVVVYWSYSYSADRAQQKTGVWESDFPAPDCSACRADIGKSCLIFREIVSAVRVRIEGGHGAIDTQLAAEFVRVVVLYPAQARVCRRLL